MKTLNQIRATLRDIRYYYSRKKMFDDNAKIVGMNDVMHKVSEFNEAIKSAKPILYDVYIGLYVNNFTQEGWAEEMGYTPEYVQMLHKDLLLFFQKFIG